MAEPSRPAPHAPSAAPGPGAPAAAPTAAAPSAPASAAVQGLQDAAGDKKKRLAAPAARGGTRRSPTTGHVRRRHQTPEPPRRPPPEDDTTEESEDGKPARTKRTLRPSASSSAAVRSLSSPGEDRGFQRISTSEDDEDYWHLYFANQSKSIAAHNGNSITAAAAGVLRPGPPKSGASRSPTRPASKSLCSERRRPETTIKRKSTADKATTDRRPSAPNFSTAKEGEPLPPTPKPMLRKRVRSKSRGPPSPTDSDENRKSASETSSTASKDTVQRNGEKVAQWRKWSLGSAPSKKEVLSIDPSEVLRGILPDEDVKKIAETQDVERGKSADEQAAAAAQADETTEQAEGWFSWSRKSSVKENEKEVTPVKDAPVKNPDESKGSLEKAKEESGTVVKSPDKKPSLFWRLFGRRKQEAKADEKARNGHVIVKREKINWFTVMRDIRVEWKAFKSTHPNELLRMRVMWNKCMASLLLVLVYCGLGGFLFRFIEGAFESLYKCGVKRVKRDFIDMLWTSSHNMREDEWKSKARRKLWEFEEQLHAAHEAGVTSYSGMKSWTFLNAVVYCLTVVTTIGYGHISPSTTTGRAATIIYAIFGIPMFLILLADFGKLFTRGIKFVWSFVRRLYYTGSCRKVRRTQPVQSACGCFCFDVMKGVQMVYDWTRRPSMFISPPNEDDPEGAGVPLRQQQQQQLQQQMQQAQILRREAGDSSEAPATPAPSAFEVDDEFNLPISVAIVILLLYIFVGASIYYIWETWGFFESFYFVFISMSTIGFGDFVPQHPMYMMASIIYLVFGLALTSMCINVVQEKLSDSFRQASAKIGATIGLRIAEEEASTNPATPPGGEELQANAQQEAYDAREITS